MPTQVKLALTASLPNGAEVTAPNPLLEIPSGTTLHLVVTAPEDISAPMLMAGDVPLEAVFTAEPADAKVWSADVPLKTAPKDDVFATVTHGPDEWVSEAMRLELGSAGSGGEGGDDGPAEVQIGEYDEAFALRTGRVFRALVFVIAGLTAWILLWILPMGGSTAESTPGFADRIASGASVLVLSVGLIGVLLGFWLAALEARGRQRARAAVVSGGTRGPLGGLTIEEIGKLAKVLSRVRGTIAAFVVGIVLIAIGTAGLAAGKVLPTGSTQTGTQTGSTSGTEQDGND